MRCGGEGEGEKLHGKMMAKRYKMLHKMRMKWDEISTSWGGLREVKI